MGADSNSLAGRWNLRSSMNAINSLVSDQLNLTENQTEHLRPKREHAYTQERVEPIFDPSTERNVTTSAGRTAHLPCRVHGLGDRHVSFLTLPIISA